MNDLIEALNIVRPYMTSYGVQYPTGADHDALYLNVDADVISSEDLARLKELSFSPNEDYAGALTSYRFGSC